MMMMMIMIFSLNTTIILRELFYDRNPGDARVKVGSDREAASSRTGPNRVSPRSVR